MISSITWAWYGLLALGWIICIYFYYRNKNQAAKIAELEKQLALLRLELQESKTRKSNEELGHDQNQESDNEIENEIEPDHEISSLLQTTTTIQPFQYSVPESTDRPVSGRSRSRGEQDVEFQNVFLNRELQVRPKLEPFKQGQSFQPI